MIGLPLGVLLVAGEKDGVLPLPKWLLQTLNIVINVLRSVPFIILMIVVIPLTRLIVGKAYGTMASVVPLVIAAFPFVARLVESSLREVDPNLIEMARSMGATPMQIITKVMLKESVPSLISNFTIAITTILGYTAMSGAVGGGGLGKLAITYGYNRYMYGVMAAAVMQCCSSCSCRCSRPSAPRPRQRRISGKRSKRIVYSHTQRAGSTPLPALFVSLKRVSRVMLKICNMNCT